MWDSDGTLLGQSEFNKDETPILDELISLLTDCKEAGLVMEIEDKIKVVEIVNTTMYPVKLECIKPLKHFIRPLEPINFIFSLGDECDGEKETESDKGEA